MVWLTDWLTEWMTDWLIDWLTDWNMELIRTDGRTTHGLTDWLTSQQRERDSQWTRELSQYGSWDPRVMRRRMKECSFMDRCNKHHFVNACWSKLFAITYSSKLDETFIFTSGRTTWLLTPRRGGSNAEEEKQVLCRLLTCMILGQ